MLGSLTQFVAANRACIEDWPERIIVEIPGEHRVLVHNILTEQVRMLLTQLASMPGECWADEAVRGDFEPAAADHDSTGA